MTETQEVVGRKLFCGRECRIDGHLTDIFLRAKATKFTYVIRIILCLCAYRCFMRSRL